MNAQVENMKKEEYTIKEEEEIDISDRDASVSLSYRGDGRSGSPVLTFETEDGIMLTVVMSREQMAELRMCLMRTRTSVQKSDDDEDKYSRLAPSGFALESEIGILLSDGIGRMRPEIASEVAQRLHLSPILYTADNALGRMFGRDVSRILDDMVAANELEFEAGAYRSRTYRWDPTG